MTNNNESKTVTHIIAVADLLAGGVTYTEVTADQDHFTVILEAVAMPNAHLVFCKTKAEYDEMVAQLENFG